MHWSIVKRTTADQVTPQAGLDDLCAAARRRSTPNFPSLGAARSAVNKTIVHPEKLTLSKAEHASAKK